MSGVEYPEMRAEVIEAVRALSDLEHQRRVWVRRELPHPGYHDDFALNLNVLYDDTSVLEDPAAAIGDVLRDDREARALAPLRDSLEDLLAKHPHLTDEQYLDTPEWPTVLATAAAALAVLTRPDEA